MVGSGVNNYVRPGAVIIPTNFVTGQIFQAPGVHNYVRPGAVIIPVNFYTGRTFPVQEPKTPISIPNPIESGIIPPSTGVTPIKIPFNTEGNEGWQNVPPSGTTQTSGIIPDNPSSGINQNQEPFDAIWGMAGIGNDPLTPENKPAIWWNPVPWSSDVPATPAEKYLVDHIILDIQYRAFKLQKQINLSKIAPSFNSIPALNLKDLDDQYRAAIEAKQVIRSFKIFISSISPELKQKMYEVPPDKIKLNLADGKSYYQSIGDWKEWYAFKAKYENQT